MDENKRICCRCNKEIKSDEKWTIIEDKYYHYKCYENYNKELEPIKYEELRLEVEDIKKRTNEIEGMLKGISDKTRSKLQNILSRSPQLGYSLQDLPNPRIQFYECSCGKGEVVTFDEDTLEAIYHIWRKHPHYNETFFKSCKVCRDKPVLATFQMYFRGGLLKGWEWWNNRLEKEQIKWTVDISKKIKLI
jgi:hypothetical protein